MVQFQMIKLLRGTYVLAVVYLGLLIPVEKSLAEYDGVEIIMQKIADTLNEINADIVLLQEVDVESKRSGFMDQMQFLLDNTNKLWCVRSRYGG